MARPVIQPAAVVTSVMFTQSDSVSETTPPWRAPARIHRWWAVPLALVGVVAVFAPVVLAVMPARWFVDTERCVERDSDGCTKQVTEAAEFALVPADAEPVDPRLGVEGADTYPSKGEIYFVTVREPPIQLLDWLAMRGETSTRLRSHTDKFGTRTEEERLRDGQRQMTGAKEWATFVGLTRAGYQPELVYGPALVDYVICLTANEANTECLEWPPAHAFLQELDQIVEVDGAPITVLDDLGAILAEHEAGDVVDVTVLRGDEEVEGEVELIQSPDEDRAILGFMPVDTRTLQLPEGVRVNFDTDNIGGPSAGLAFTLTLIDDLTEGDLTGGAHVAVTGAIYLDGTVGAIGGLNSKASAVQQVGVKYFLVPASQPAEGPDSIAAAQAVVGDSVQLIPVATLDEALEVLQRLGGDPVPEPEAPPTTDA